MIDNAYLEVSLYRMLSLYGYVFFYYVTLVTIQIYTHTYIISF